MIAYKVLFKKPIDFDEYILVSATAIDDWQREYCPGKPTCGLPGTKLFVCDTEQHALDFMEELLGQGCCSNEFEVWECEVPDDVGPVEGGLLVSSAYWREWWGLSDWLTDCVTYWDYPPGTLLADWVKPIRRLPCPTK